MLCNKHSFLLIFGSIWIVLKRGVCDEKDGLDGIPVTYWSLYIEINYYQNGKGCWCK
jgi:hypothetical protein